MGDEILTEKEESYATGKVVQVVAFQLGEEEYAVDILNVQEIVRLLNITRVPRSPEYIDGVVNLRGTVLPVVDLSSRLGWGLTEPTQRHVIIVVRIADQLQGLIGHIHHAKADGSGLKRLGLAGGEVLKSHILLHLHEKGVGFQLVRCCEHQLPQSG